MRQDTPHCGVKRFGVERTQLARHFSCAIVDRSNEPIILIGCALASFIVSLNHGASTVSRVDDTQHLSTRDPRCVPKMTQRFPRWKSALDQKHDSLALELTVRAERIGDAEST